MSIIGTLNHAHSVKLDWVGPVDSRPYTDKVHHFIIIKFRIREKLNLSTGANCSTNIKNM